MLVAGPTRVMNIIISRATCIKASVARTVLVNVLFQEIFPDPSSRIGTRLTQTWRPGWYKAHTDEIEVVCVSEPTCIYTLEVTPAISSGIVQVVIPYH